MSPIVGEYRGCIPPQVCLLVQRLPKNQQKTAGLLNAARFDGLPVMLMYIVSVDSTSRQYSVAVKVAVATARELPSQSSSHLLSSAYPAHIEDLIAHTIYR